MAAATSREIEAVWRALSGNRSTPGWHSIELLGSGSCRVRAARHSPGNEEAVLVGFSKTRIAPNAQLPQGRGFRMERATLGEAGGTHQWLSVVRQPAGSLELFAAVAADICGLVLSLASLPEDVVYQRLLGRVRGWQEFMRRGAEGLGAEAELGLVGEIHVLRNLLDEGMPLFTAVDGWKGPLDGLHDFRLGSGAIEVKSTLAAEGFPIRIASLDQLDDAQCSPLHLCALRFAQNDAGASLPELVMQLRNRLDPDPTALRLFERALDNVGYLDMHAEGYTRRFSVIEVRLHLVNGDFPRLTPCNVPPAVRRASYDLDLGLVPAGKDNLAAVLAQLGAV
ncbi:PD-(D/E)XK motif protein [Pseudomonas stutzeri]|uniref:PD-(D/E)XK motif protein n=1 Tax=Stutzerimonas stutzeri TaxID=316 RepID=UPI0003636C3F|nr:PD-(D/E)XK motif protein [Stutzerimonas stutzeri]MBO0643629.1 PD-(D/E)XK motif protein [Stutzerimonas stutzeri]